MPRSSGPVWLLVLLSCLSCALSSPAAAQGGDHILISEFAVTPTDGEFVEIFNPTSVSVDLSNYYICDYALRFVDGQSGDQEPDNDTNYWHLPDGRLLPEPDFPIDFVARFPAGTIMAPGQTYVISMKDDRAFSNEWSTTLNEVTPDFELIQDGDGDGVADMVDPGPEILGDGDNNRYILADAGLSNAREVVILFYWDGETDLVEDVDIVQWGNAGSVFTTLSPDKTGVAVDGPDPDDLATPYRPDTSRDRQELAHNGAHDFGFTVTRRDFSEGNERLIDGNGRTGHDETSENFTATWLPNTDHSIGNPGQFGPPEVVAAASNQPDLLILTFSRAVSQATAEDPGNYAITQVETAGGAAANQPLRVLGATLDASGVVVVLETDPVTPVALYQLLATDIQAEGTAERLITKPVFYRGFNRRPAIELDVPNQAYIPTLDGFYEITYTAPQGATVLVRMFDVQGRELFVVAEERVPAGGRKTIQWDGRDDLRQRLPAGVYVLHAQIEGTGEEVVAPVVVAATSGLIR